MTTADHTPSEAAMANLTDEERAVLLDPEFSEGELAAMKTIAGDDEGDPDEVLDADGKPVTPVLEVKPDAGAKAEPEPEPELKPKTEPAPAARAPDPYLGSYQAQLPADFAQQVDALKEQSSQLGTKFKDGEIDVEAYQTELAQISTQREELMLQRAKAEISAAMTQQQTERAWFKVVDDVKDEAKTKDGIDYRTDTAKAKDLDRFVKVLAADEDNADKSMRWFVEEAHKCVLARHGIAPAAPAPTNTKPAPRTPPIEAVPKNLSQVPGGDGPGDIARDEFTAIDELDGWELQDALAKLSPEARARFARGK